MVKKTSNVTIHGVLVALVIGTIAVLPTSVRAVSVFVASNLTRAVQDEPPLKVTTKYIVDKCSDAYIWTNDNNGLIPFRFAKFKQDIYISDDKIRVRIENEDPFPLGSAGHDYGGSGTVEYEARFSDLNFEKIEFIDRDSHFPWLYIRTIDRKTRVKKKVDYSCIGKCNKGDEHKSYIKQVNEFTILVPPVYLDKGKNLKNALSNLIKLSGGGQDAKDPFDDN
jgi:hypothetical protein